MLKLLKLFQKSYLQTFYTKNYVWFFYLFFEKNYVAIFIWMLLVISLLPIT